MKAKTIILLLTIVFISINSHAQTNVSYTYDSAGNRVSRAIVVSRGEDGRWTEDSAIQLAEGIDTTSCRTIDYQESVYDILSKIDYNDVSANCDYRAFYERVLGDCARERGKRNNLDTTRAIGRIPLSSGSTPFGAKTYSIPIPTAAGLSLVPSIHLDYSSLAANGVAGYGWSLGGISAIKIRNKTRYYDGTVVSAQRGTNAAFSLDGIPLVTNDIESLVTEGYTLQTVHGFIVVKKHITNGVITHFTALFPDGSSATYGWSANNKNLCMYPLTEKTDILGNRIVYYYDSNFVSPHQSIRIQEIDYGFDGNGTPLGRITFSYSQRTDILTTYCDGVDVSDPYILNRIVSYSYSGNQYEELCRYGLSHSIDEGVYQLTGISCSSGGVYLNPVSFGYISQEKPDYSHSETFVEDVSAIMTNAYPDTTDVLVRKRGKFKIGSFADGVVVYPKRNQYALIYASGGNEKWGSEYASNQKIFIAPEIEGGPVSVDYLLAGSGFQTLEPVDVDGDGADELVKINFGTASSKTLLTITIYEYTPNESEHWTGSSFNVQVAGVVAKGFYSPVRLDYFFGDYDGDGKTELLTVSYNFDTWGNRPSYTSLIDLDAHSLLSDVEDNIDYPSSDNRVILPVDLRASGKAELFCISDSGVLREYTRVGNNMSYSGNIYGGGSDILSLGGPRLADVNGDGYLDFVIPGSNNTYQALWSSYLFTGTSLQHLPYRSGLYLSDEDDLLFIDLNRDGMADAAVHKGNTLRTGINRGNGNFDFTTSSTINVSPSFNMLACSEKEYANRSRLISLEGIRIKRYEFPNDRSFGRMISSSTDSYGNKLYSTYRNIAEQTAIYGQDPTIVPTIADGYYKADLPLYLLWNEIKTSGGQIVGDADYYYTNLLANRKQGFGICGFSNVKSSEYIQGVRTETDYNPERFGIVKGVKSYLTSSTVSFYTVSNTYTEMNHPYRKIIPRLTGTVSTDALTGIISTQTIRYTDYDLPSYVSQSRRIGESGTKQVTSQSFTYENTTSVSRYILGSVMRKLSISNINDDGTFWKRQEDYTYNSIGQPVSIAYSEGPYNSGTTKTLEKHFTYNSQGKVLTEKSAKYNTTSYYGWTYTYDSNGRYLTSKTDAIGLKTQYSNYDKFGNPQTVKDYNRNKTTAHTYDAWGNLVRTVHPDGSIDSVLRRWGGAGLYTIKTKSTGKPDRDFHYDALDREIRKGEIRFDGHWGYTDTKYNSRGQLDSVSLPYKDTTLTPTYWNTYSYDVYGRQTRKRDASGKSITYSYSGTTTTTVNEGLTYYQVKDASGNVTQDRSYYGNVNYTYRDDGQLASISTTQQGQTITYSYDNLGRCTGIADPNSGTRTTSYQWNSNGSSVVTETNPNGSVVTSYDQYGRVTNINYPGRFSTTYTYNNHGELTGETSSHGISKSYSYDQYGRLSIYRESAPGIPLFAKYISYGPGSNLSAIYYSDESQSFTSEHYIYQNGHNTAIMLSDSSYVIRIVEENALGQVTKAETEPSTGPAPSHGIITSKKIYRSYSFDEYGYPTGRRFAVKRSTIGHMVDVYLTDETYSFNHNTGNLLSRNSLNLNESFGYDLVNRLYGSSASNYWYGINGNISWRNDGGQQTFQATGSDGYKLTSLRARTDSLVAPRSQTISYTGFDRPDVITEGDRTCRFTYDAARNRVRTVIAEGDSTILKRWYVGGNYERDSTATGITERIYLGGDAYSAPAVLVRRSNQPNAFFAIGRDYQGSITYLRRADGQEDYEYNYDPWGNIRYADGNTIPLTYRQVPELFLGRGYTGHEHLPYFGLINMNARLYDPVTTRFLSPDPFIQAPHDFQNYNRYSYCLNNPLKYTDKSGEFVWTAALIVAGVSIIIDYGIQVVSNYAQSKKNPDITRKDIFWNNIDWFDIAVSGIIGGLTGGFGAAVKSGEIIGKFGQFILNNTKILKGAEILLTSAVDLTGSGWQTVSFKQFATRTVSGLANMAISDAISSIWSETSSFNGDSPSQLLPKQKHHFATNKNKRYTPLMQAITDKYGLDLDGDWNIEVMNHLGRHPNAYHQFVLDSMRQIDFEAEGNQKLFIDLFNLYVRQTVLDHPEMLRKSFWVY